MCRAETAALVAAAALACSLASSCRGCEERDDESAIRALIQNGADLAEKKALGDLMALTTPDFTARPHDMTRQEVKGVLLVAFRRYGTFTIRHPSPSVEIAPSERSATAELPFLIVSEDRDIPDIDRLYDDPESWLEQVSEMADLYHLKLDLVKEDGDWKVEKARMRGTRGLGSF